MVVWTSELFLLWDLSFAYGKGDATMRQLSIFFGWRLGDLPRKKFRDLHELYKACTNL